METLNHTAEIPILEESSIIPIVEAPPISSAVKRVLRKIKERFLREKKNDSMSVVFKPMTKAKKVVKNM